MASLILPAKKAMFTEGHLFITVLEVFRFGLFDIYFPTGE